jgi:hypothetical protein
MWIRPPRRAALPATLIVAVAASGCLSSTYEIRRDELARLASLPPETRGASVEVDQELFGSELEPAQPVDGSTQVVIIGHVDIGPGRPPPGARPRPVGGGGGGAGGSRGGSGGGKAMDAKDAAVALLVLATFGLVIGAAIEGQRYEGTVQLHPMHPVHLFGYDGNYTIMPLAHLHPGVVGWARSAVVRSSEGPFLFLERAPLRRQGLTYGVHFGVATLTSADGTNSTGPAGTIQFGYFPDQRLGFVGSAAFAWRENLVQQTLYGQRYSLELQAMPLAASIFHAGGYANVGLAWRLEDGFVSGNSRSLSWGGGAQLQLDVNTHLAVTARAGISHAYGDYHTEASVGLAVY